MPTIRHRIVLGTSALIAGAVLAVGSSATAQATPSHPTAVASTATALSFACGYDGYSRGHDNQPLYNHCGTGSVVIEVDHFFWQTTYACMPPGVYEIPQGTSQWRIIGAEYDGHTCTYRSPIALVGP